MLGNESIFDTTGGGIAGLESITQKINVVATVNSLDTMIRDGIERFAFSSAVAVQGESALIPYLTARVLPTNESGKNNREKCIQIASSKTQ